MDSNTKLSACLDAACYRLWQTRPDLGQVQIARVRDLVSRKIQGETVTISAAEEADLVDLLLLLLVALLYAML